MSGCGLCTFSHVRCIGMTAVWSFLRRTSFRMARLGGRSPVIRSRERPVDGIAERPSGLERRHARGHDGDRLACAWIPALACCAVPGGEGSESRNSDGLAVPKGFGDDLEHGTDRGGGFRFRERRAAGNIQYEVRTVHGRASDCVRRAMVDDASRLVEPAQVRRADAYPSRPSSTVPPGGCSGARRRRRSFPAPRRSEHCVPGTPRPALLEVRPGMSSP